MSILNKKYSYDYLLSPIAADKFDVLIFQVIANPIIRKNLSHVDAVQHVTIYNYFHHIMLF